MSGVKIGCKAKDVVSGFEGVVTGVIDYRYNCRRALVRPQKTGGDGKPVEGEWFDEPSLKVTSEKTHCNIIPVPPRKFGMGDVVKDIVSGLKGEVIGVASYANGCIRMGVQPAVVKDGKIADEVWLPQDQLKLVKAVKTPAAKTTTGGPMRDPGYKW